MEGAQKKYELTYILSPDIQDEEIDRTEKKIREIINKSGGIVEEKREMGKRKLSYKMNHFRHGYFVILNISCDPNQVEKLSSCLRLKKEILRHLIAERKEKPVSQKMKSLKIVKQEKKISEELKPELEERPKEKLPQKEKIKLEDIDKKLDEILEGEL